MEILQPAKLMDDTETDDGDPLLLAQHGKAGSKARLSVFFHSVC